MKRAIIPLLILLSVWTAADGQVYWQTVLDTVEMNNASLAARRKLADAQALEARTGNSLENPTISYDRMWGTPAALGVSGELNVTQAFDFPTVYANRAKLAALRAKQYGYEYAAYRQQVLLSARELCINLIALRKQEALLARIRDDARQTAELFRKRAAAGDATVLEENKVEFEVLAAQNAYDLNQIELQTAEKQLANLNGGKPITLLDKDFPPREVLPPFEELYARYEEADPTLLAMAVEKDAAERDVKLSRSLSLPKLELGYRREFSTGEKFNGITMGMSIPMFGNRNNVKRAQAQSAYAQVQLQSGRIDLRTRLEQLYQQAQLLAASLTQYEKMASTQTAVEMLNKAVAEGQISVVDYYAELAPIYTTLRTLIEVERDLHLTYARIHMLEL